MVDEPYLVLEIGVDIRSVHFIGIGGVGMSGIALVALHLGINVSGSDIAPSEYTRRLEDCGAVVRYGHDAVNLASSGELPDVVVVSTAIAQNNVEYAEARRLGIPVWHRAQMLAYVAQNKRTLAVSGTHGKTTGSSLLTYVLQRLGADPMFIVGGTLNNYATNAGDGDGEYCVVEADESDKSFTFLNPFGVIVTNIEADHLDHYSGVDEIREKFTRFMSLVPPEGFVVVCGQDESLVHAARTLRPDCITYGLSDACDVWVDEFSPCGTGCTFALHTASHGTVQCRLLQNPGIHNALNAAGVLALVEALGLDVVAAGKVLGDFEGVHRRFERVGTEACVTVVDDYAHHPTEIRSTIEAARDLSFRRVIVLFQPHRYSRLHLFGDVLRDEFSHAFDAADYVVFTDVYSAGEKPLAGVDGNSFLDIVRRNEKHPACAYCADKDDAVLHVAEYAREGDLVITMGAGDVTRLGPQILRALGQKE